MKLFQQAVTDENDIYVYFEVIKNVDTLQKQVCKNGKRSPVNVFIGN